MFCKNCGNQIPDGVAGFSRNAEKRQEQFHRIRMQRDRMS